MPPLFQVNQLNKFKFNSYEKVSFIIGSFLCSDGNKCSRSTMRILQSAEAQPQTKQKSAQIPQEAQAPQ